MFCWLKAWNERLAPRREDLKRPTSPSLLAWGRLLRQTRCKKRLFLRSSASLFVFGRTTTLKRNGKQAPWVFANNFKRFPPLKFASRVLGELLQAWKNKNMRQSSALVCCDCRNWKMYRCTVSFQMQLWLLPIVKTGNIVKCCYDFLDDPVSG